MNRDRLLRLPEVLELLPISKSTWWNGLKTGRYNIETIKLGPRTTTWRESDVLKLVEQGVQSKV